MEANELRIGNYISVNNCVQEVVELPLPRNCTDENTHPLQITEYWLLKFGFNKDYQSGYIGIDVLNSDFLLTYPEVMGE